MSTNPATAPEQKPTKLGLPLTIHSHIGHTNEPTAVASVVVVKALAAMTSPATALPELNPYQPTHSMDAPMNVSTTLCGAKFSLPKPRRLPRMIHSTKPDQPDDMCTTVPPAKSRPLILASAFQQPFIMPLTPQTMWPWVLYTNNIHSVMKTKMAENFMRSAIEPTMSAGVIMANINWNMAYTF